MTLKRAYGKACIVLLKNAQAGTRVQDLCLKRMISDATFYKWRTKMPAWK